MGSRGQPKNVQQTRSGGGRRSKQRKKNKNRKGKVAGAAAFADIQPPHIRIGQTNDKIRAFMSKNDLVARETEIAGMLLYHDSRYELALQQPNLDENEIAAIDLEMDHLADEQLEIQQLLRLKFPPENSADAADYDSAIDASAPSPRAHTHSATTSPEPDADTHAQNRPQRSRASSLTTAHTEAPHTRARSHSAADSVSCSAAASVSHTHASASTSPRTHAHAHAHTNNTNDNGQQCENLDADEDFEDNEEADAERDTERDADRDGDRDTETEVDADRGDGFASEADREREREREKAETFAALRASMFGGAQRETKTTTTTTRSEKDAKHSASSGLSVSHYPVPVHTMPPLSVLASDRALLQSELSFQLESGHLTEAKQILSVGPIGQLINAQDEQLRYTPLGAAINAAGERADIVSVLLKLRADPNLRFKKTPSLNPWLVTGDLPLDSAVELGKASIVTLLLNAGARLDNWDLLKRLQREHKLGDLRGQATALRVMKALVDGGLEQTLCCDFYNTKKPFFECTHRPFCEALRTRLRHREQSSERCLIELRLLPSSMVRLIVGYAAVLPPMSPRMGKRSINPSSCVHT